MTVKHWKIIVSSLISGLKSSFCWFGRSVVKWRALTFAMAYQRRRKKKKSRKCHSSFVPCPSFTFLFPSGSVYRDEFDLAILKLQEDNRLEILKRKWWDGGKCPKEEDHRAKGLSLQLNPHLGWWCQKTLIPPNPGISPGLGMENIGGIFVVLVCGLLVAIFMAVLEFVWMLRHAPGNEVREGYLTCICFVSLSPPWHLPPRGAARFFHSAQLWQEVMSTNQSNTSCVFCIHSREASIRTIYILHRIIKLYSKKKDLVLVIFTGCCKSLSQP